MKLVRQRRVLKGMLAAIAAITIGSVIGGIATAQPNKTQGIPSISSIASKEETDTDPVVDCYRDDNNNNHHDEDEPIARARRSVCREAGGKEK